MSCVKNENTRPQKLSDSDSKSEKFSYQVLSLSAQNTEVALHRFARFRNKFWFRILF